MLITLLACCISSFHPSNVIESSQQKHHHVLMYLADGPGGGRTCKGKLGSCLTADLTFAQIDLQENYPLPYFTPHLARALHDDPC